MNLSGRTRLHPGAVNDRMKNTSASDAGNVSLDDELSVHRLGFGAMRLTGVVYYLHIPDPIVSFDVSLDTLAQLRGEGKIRLVGLSNVTQEHIKRARKIVPIVSVQNRYSFADREWDYVVDYCARNEIAFVPWFPLGAGKLAAEVLNRVANEQHKKPMQVALAWLLQRSPIMLPIPGTSSIEHLEENIAASSLRLTAEQYQELARVPELVASR